MGLVVGSASHIDIQEVFLGEYAASVGRDKRPLSAATFSLSSADGSEGFEMTDQALNHGQAH